MYHSAPSERLILISSHFRKHALTVVAALACVAAFPGAAQACHCSNIANDVPFCACDEHPEIAVTAGSTTNGSFGSSLCNFWFNWPYFDVFYSFTPTTTGMYTIDMCGTPGDSAMAIYSGCSAGTNIALADNQCSSLDPSIDIMLTAGHKYWIECGARDSNPAIGGINEGGALVLHVSNVTVCNSPSISTQPNNETRCEGGAVNFSVVASGTAPLGFQWRKNGGNIGGATSSSLTINPVNAADAGSYDCVVSNSCGSATSSAGSLAVDTAASITGQPSGQTVCEGGMATFSVTAAGSPAPTFQWRKNGGNIAGETGSSITINPVAAADAGSYDCVVSNSCGSSTSSAANLSVDTGPAITGQPAGDAVCEGDIAAFSVTAGGSPAPTFQWRLGGVDLIGETGSSLTLNPVIAADAGAYDVVVTNVCGSVTSNVANLTVDTAPTITSDPSGQGTCEDDQTILSVSISSTLTPSFQWRKNGVNLADGGAISGATTNTLTIDPTILSDAGNYDVVVDNACGSDTSTVAAVTVTPRPVGDADGDGDVDITDLGLVLANFGMTGAGILGDIDNDGDVDITDLGLLLSTFGMTC